MATGNEAIMERVRGLLESGDYTGVTRLLDEVTTDDFEQVWPQSGERIRKENVGRLAESYGASTGTNPEFTFHRMIGGGDVFVTEGQIDYGNGTVVSYVGVTEFRDGRIARQTEYFANPFEAPEWRKEFVEPMSAASSR